MRCPFCGNIDTQVKDSRPAEDHVSIRRRRFCSACGGRFTTYERVQLRDLVDHTNSFLAQQPREAWGGIMLNGEPIKAKKKYSNEDIGALPEPLLDRIVEGMGLFCRFLSLWRPNFYI